MTVTLSSDGQLKHLLQPFVTLINKFTQRPNKTDWTKELWKALQSRRIEEKALDQLANLRWSTALEPRDRECKFAFQVSYPAWKKIIEDYPIIERQLVKHAQFILANIKTMVKFPDRRGLLR